MAERKTVVHDQAWFDAVFRVIRTAPQAQAEVELRALIRDVGTAAMARAMRVWLEARRPPEAQKETEAPKRERPAPRYDAWAQGVMTLDPH